MRSSRTRAYGAHRRPRPTHVRCERRGGHRRRLQRVCRARSRALPHSTTPHTLLRSCRTPHRRSEDAEVQTTTPKLWPETTTGSRSAPGSGVSDGDWQRPPSCRPSHATRPRSLVVGGGRGNASSYTTRRFCDCPHRYCNRSVPFTDPSPFCVGCCSPTECNCNEACCEIEDESD